MEQVKNSKLKISIVTAAYNAAATVRRTVESVLGQTYDNIEYIVVDGKSSDDTVKIVEEYRDKFEQKGYTLTVVSERDNGIYDAMNKGITLATGDIVGMINADDWYEPGAVQTVAETYAEKPFDCFYADLNLVHNNGKITVKRAKLDKRPTTRHWNHPTTFITKQTYNDVGLYACRCIYDDWDMLLRLRRAGKVIAVKNVVLANFTLNGVSHSKSLKKVFQRIKIKYSCYKRNGYGFSYYPVECFLMEIAKCILG